MKFGRDIKLRRTEMSQGNCVATRISMSQPTAQQETKNKRTISVATIRFSVVIIRFSVAIETTEESKRYLLGHRKLDRNRVDRLK